MFAEFEDFATELASSKLDVASVFMEHEIVSPPSPRKRSLAIAADAESGSEEPVSVKKKRQHCLQLSNKCDMTLTCNDIHIRVSAEALRHSDSAILRDMLTDRSSTTVDVSGAAHHGSGRALACFLYELLSKQPTGLMSNTSVLRVVTPLAFYYDSPSVLARCDAEFAAKCLLPDGALSEATARALLDNFQFSTQFRLPQSSAMLQRCISDNSWQLLGPLSFVTAQALPNLRTEVLSSFLVSAAQFFAANERQLQNEHAQIQAQQAQQQQQLEEEMAQQVALVQQQGSDLQMWRRRATQLEQSNWTLREQAADLRDQLDDALDERDELRAERDQLAEELQALRAQLQNPSSMLSCSRAMASVALAELGL